jgi:putative intracellular protease/amidase
MSKNGEAFTSAEDDIQKADLPVVPICRGSTSLISPPNHRQHAAIPSRSEGRIAIVTDAGWDAVDAAAPLTNGAQADGEVVWS